MIDPSKRAEILADFMAFCQQMMKLENLPKMNFVSDNSWAKEHKSFGMFDRGTGEVSVYVNNRNLADICRTLAHELVHVRQGEMNQLSNGSGATGSDIENEANEIAGILMREYGNRNTSIYE